MAITQAKEGRGYFILAMEPKYVCFNESCFISCYNDLFVMEPHGNGSVFKRATVQMKCPCS